MDLVHLYQRTRPTVTSCLFQLCTHFLKLNENKVIEIIILCKSFVFSVFSIFQQSAGSTSMHGLPGTHNINEWGKQPGKMLKCWDKLRSSGRAGQLHRRGSWLVAVNGQWSFLAAFLWAYVCSNFHHDPQARWLGDPRILKPLRHSAASYCQWWAALHT